MHVRRLGFYINVETRGNDVTLALDQLPTIPHGNGTVYIPRLCVSFLLSPLTHLLSDSCPSRRDVVPSCAFALGC